MITTRTADVADLPFLLHVIAIAADWRDGVDPRPVADVLASADLAHYAPDWTRSGDQGLIAEDEVKRSLGAAWWRFFAADDPGYGFVTADVPEVTVGVLPGHRGRGLGTRLMRELIQQARREHLPALSLSVEPDNSAARLYAQLGFIVVGRNGGAVTMLLPLHDCATAQCRA